MEKLNIIGERYNKLLVLEEVDKSKYNRRFKCLCDCGNITIVAMNNMRSGKIASCGCHKLEQLLLRNTTHNQRHTHLYEIWKGIKQRCYNPKHRAYHNWGGRGIKMCEDWKNNFQSFYDWSYANGYTLNNHYKKENDKLTIDRIDVNGDYCPDNCRWVKRIEQARNTRTNRNLIYKGEELCLSEWCEYLNLNYPTIYSRLNKGWSIERAFETPTKRPYIGTHK